MFVELLVLCTRPAEPELPSGPIGREEKGTPRRGVPAESEAEQGGGAPCVIMGVWTG